MQRLVNAKVGQLDPILIYPVTEQELNELEQSDGGSMALNLALVFLTTAVSVTVTWLTLHLETVSTIGIGVMSGILCTCYPLGAFYLIRSVKSKNRISIILDRIRARMEGEIAQEVEVQLEPIKENAVDPIFDD